MCCFLIGRNKSSKLKMCVCVFFSVQINLFCLAFRSAWFVWLWFWDGVGKLIWNQSFSGKPQGKQVTQSTKHFSTAEAFWRFFFRFDIKKLTLIVQIFACCNFVECIDWNGTLSWNTWFPVTDALQIAKWNNNRNYQFKLFPL